MTDDFRQRAWRVALRGGPALLLLAAAFHLALPTDEGGRAVWDALADDFVASRVEILGWVLAGTLLYGTTLACAALRFDVLLRAAGIQTPFPHCLRMVLVAHFFNSVLPGGVVGDVWRVYDGHDQTRRGPAVLSVVAVERVLGLQALGLVAIGAVPFATRDVLGAEIFGPVAMAAAACAFAPLALLVPAVGRSVRGAANRGAFGLSRFPRVKRVLEETLDGFAQLRADRGRLLFAVAASLVCQGVPVVAVWALAQPLAGHVQPVWFAILVPFVTLMSMLPISVGGTGVREVLFVSLFGRVGLSASAGLVLGLSIGAVNLVWAVLGGVLFAVGRRRSRAMVSKAADA